APARLFAAEAPAGQHGYAVDIGILYSLLSFHLDGMFEERVDRAAGRYEIRGTGTGSGIANRIESRGVLRDGRWTPLQSLSWFEIHDRVSETRLAYDLAGRRVEYHARGETFFMRRLRVVDDVVGIPDGLHVDDALSAALNYRDGRWTPDAGGRLRTYIVRRRRTENEGPDDVARAYRGEIVPLDLTVTADPESRAPAALIDFSRFTSWARQNQPARIVFDAERRPASITGSMILGSSLSIRFV
ncbi:MAG TPA: hypothetical protein VFL90_07410, partial [Methylomirabilota bacterium]|nr:hypothetical protein [Methylomirabilota bacterium]